MKALKGYNFWFFAVIVASLAPYVYFAQMSAVLYEVADFQFDNGLGARKHGIGLHGNGTIVCRISCQLPNMMNPIQSFFSLLELPGKNKVQILTAPDEKSKTFLQSTILSERAVVQWL